jgi:hypothetical protein
VVAQPVPSRRLTSCSRIEAGWSWPPRVVAETAWMIESRLGPAAEARFLGLVIEGHLQVPLNTPSPPAPARAGEVIPPIPACCKG